MKTRLRFQNLKNQRKKAPLEKRGSSGVISNHLVFTLK